MKSILEIYKQGMGPSSTLNMVPYRACADVADEIHLKREHVNHIEINLYNEYARLADEAGIRHDIDYAFALSNFKYAINKDKPCPPQLRKTPYAFDIVIFKEPTVPSYRHRVIANGGSYYFSERRKHNALPFENYEEVKKWFDEHPDARYLDFCSLGNDRDEIKSAYYRGVNLAEMACLEGLKRSGKLDVGGNIHYMRQARNIWLHDESFLTPSENANRIISALSYAIGEQVCEKSVILAAPTVCTTSVVWSMIMYFLDVYHIPSKRMIDAFCAAGIFASLVDNKASLAPIDVGCQGPMGTACGMAAVIAAVVMYDAKIDECARVFEMALEHSLGVICDALTSLPIIPCIQRCASYATRAYELAVINHSLMATPELCKLDDLITVIKETGGALMAKNRRLGVGGFADHAKYSLQPPTKEDWE